MPLKLTKKNEPDDIMTMIIDLDEQVSLEGRVVNGLQEVFGIIFGLHGFFFTVVSFFLKGILDRTLRYDKVTSTKRFSPDLKGSVVSSLYQAKDFTKTFS